MKIFILSAISIICINSYSQLYAPDFTMTDTQGHTYNLHDECAQGKTVVLDFFYRFCGTCQINTPKLDSIWHNYGADGSTVWVWGIEGVIGPTSGTNAEVDSFKTTYGATYPCFSTEFNDDTILYLYDILYTPKYFVVCPDTRMKPTGIDDLEHYIEICLASSGINNTDGKTTGIRSINYFYDQIIIDYYSENIQNISFDICSAQGQKMITVKNDYFNEQIIISKKLLKPGCYFIQMKNYNIPVDTKKIVIL
ncbi:MAG: redoxin family protein [Bacteroidota bacterium]